VSEWVVQSAPLRKKISGLAEELSALAEGRDDYSFLVRLDAEERQRVEMAVAVLVSLAGKNPGRPTV